MSYESYLEHHGIKGMKWGVRRTPEELGHINGGEAKVYKLHNYKGHLYFISEKEMDGKTLKPRVPENFLTRYGFEDNTTERICFSHDPGKCLTAMSANVSGKTFNVYEPAEKHDVYKPNKFTVPDAEITGEMWVKEPVKLKKVGSIRCTGDTGEDGLKYTYGDNTAELYDWNYEWLSHTSYLEHHGVKGQKWGIRRYRNADGTLTEAGKKRASKQYRKYALRAQNDFNNDLTGIRIRTYNHAADKMNNGGIKKYNEDYDKKLGDKAKNHDYSTDEEYIKGYERLFKQELDKSAASVAIEYWEGNKNYRKAKAIADKYSLYDFDDIAKSQSKMMDDLRLIAEGKE